MKNALFQEFNMSRWLDLLGDSTEDITWKDIMFERLCWHESSKDIRLADWENKLGMKAIFKHYEIASAEIYMQTSQAHTPTLKKDLEKLISQNRDFIIKPSHLCGSQSIYKYVDGNFETVEAFNPVSPNYTSEEADAVEADTIKTDAIEAAPNLGIDADNLVEKVMQSTKERCAPREAWSLRNCRPGILIEEVIPFELDIRVMTVWGKFQGIRIMGKEKIWIDQNGNLLNDTETAEDIMAWLEPHLSSIQSASERIAQNTDMLRVDFLVSRSGAIKANELCSFVWPEANTFLPFYKNFTKNFLAGYEKFSGQLVERKFARLHI